MNRFMMHGRSIHPSVIAIIIVLGRNKFAPPNILRVIAAMLKGDSAPDIVTPEHVSSNIRYCCPVLTSLSVFLSGLWALPLLLFSVQILAWK